jgi:hypothetical protein
MYLYLTCSVKLSVIMPVCMADYMMADYKHANHAFNVNVRY